jgi:2-polyprenyl-3-methyl-5-hydroxy-6-metoxy-1,4-benzoquinol methylase
MNTTPSPTSSPAPARPPAGDPELARAALESNPHLWYHTIDLAPGITTPGYIDMRKAASKVLPADMSGMKVLDIGTFDGFWAFAMEERGAEVTTADLETITDADWPPVHRPRLEAQAERDGLVLGEGFRLAKKALGSNAERVVCNIYELSPERVDGPFDLVYVGAILTHLRDPITPLINVRSVLKPGGEFRTFEPISARLTFRLGGRPAVEFKATNTDYTWWLPNTKALVQWLVAAGFGDVERYALDRPPCAERTWYAAFRGTNPGSSAG